MRRRRLLLGVGSVASATAFVTGSGAFTSVAANRSLDIAVSDDGTALLRLAPCEGPNGAYVVKRGGTTRLDLSSANSDVEGTGVNANATTVIDDILAIENQGTQPVGVWLDPPKPVTNANGDPAVKFYRGGDPDKGIVGEANAVCLTVGQQLCVGFLTRTYGLESGDSLFESGGRGRITVRADAGVACETGSGS
jgi:hypothetical protein